MLNFCFGTFAVLSLFTFLMFVGTLVDAQRPDKSKFSK